MPDVVDASTATERHQVVAEHHRRTTMRTLEPSDPPPGVEVRNALHAPLLVDEACWVTLGEHCFELAEEGLYRFWDWGRTRHTDPAKGPEWVSEDRRYCNIIRYESDILALLGAIATLQHHGDRHHPLAFGERMEVLRGGSLSLTCGPSSEFVRDLLGTLGYTTRPVSCVRLHGPWTGWNDGHILNEFYWPEQGKWVLLDVNAHRMFVDGDEFLGAGEVTARVRAGESFNFHWLTARGLPMVDMSYEVLGEFPRSSFGIGRWNDDDAMRKSLGGMLEMILLPDGDHWWFYSDDPEHIDRILKYREHARVLPHDEWLQKFYGAPTP